MMFSRPFRLHALHLCSLVRRFSGSVRKFATRTAPLVTVLTENPPARHMEFSLGTAGKCFQYRGQRGLRQHPSWWVIWLSHGKLSTSERRDTVATETAWSKPKNDNLFLQGKHKADSWASSGLNGQTGRFFAVEIFAGVVVRAKRGSPFRADTIARSCGERPRCALGLGHLRFNQADNGHHDSAPNPSTANAGKNGRHV